MNIHRPRQNAASAIVGTDISELPAHLEAERRKLHRTLDTGNEAASNALRGIPASNATEPDAFEKQLTHLAEKKITFFREDAEGALGQLSEELHHHDVEVFELEDIEVEAQKVVDQVKAENFDLLQSICDEDYRAGMDWRDFRRQRRPTLHDRPPMYSDDWFLTVLVLVSMYFIELLGNSLIVEPHVRGGLEEAWITCGAVAGVNIGFGFLAGFAGLRHFRYGIGPARDGGFLVVLIAGLLGLVVNVQFARFRDALQYSGQARWDDFHWMHEPWTAFAFQSLMSFALFALGLGSFLIAAWKGYGGKHSPHDPCPGYSTTDRRKRQAEHNLHTAKNEIMNAVTDALETLCKTLVTERSNTEKRHCIEALKIANTASERASERVDKARGFVKVTNAERHHYRETIADIRGRDWQRPPYFKIYPTFDEMLADFPTADDHRQRATAAQETYKRNLHQMSIAKRELARLASIELRKFFEAVAAMHNRAREHYHDQQDTELSSTPEVLS